MLDQDRRHSRLPLIPALIFAAMVMAGVPAHPQAPDRPPVHWKAHPPDAPVRQGDRFEIRIEATIDEGWHLYSTTQPPPPRRTLFSLPPGGMLQMESPVRQTDPKKELDPNFGIQTETFTGSADFWIPLRTPADAKPGEYEASLQVVYQVCNDQVCLPPKKAPIPFKVKIAAGAPVKAAAAPAVPVPPDSAAQKQGAAAVTDGSAPQPGGIAPQASSSRVTGTAAEVE